MSTTLDTKHRMIGVEDVLTLTGWNAKTLERRVIAREFPQPIEGGSGKKRKWTLHQYEAWAKRKESEAAKLS